MIERSEMIDISRLRTWDNPHKVYIPSRYGVFVKKDDLEKLLETAHNAVSLQCPFLLVERFADNGEHSHWVLVNCETGEEEWSQQASA